MSLPGTVETSYAGRFTDSCKPKRAITYDNSISSTGIDDAVFSTRINSLDLAIMRLLPLFALLTLTQELPLLTYANRVAAFVLLALILFSLLRGGMAQWKYVALSMYVAVCIIACGLTHWSGQMIAAAPRGLFCISFLLYVHTRFDDCRIFCIQSYKYLQAIVVIWTILVAVSIPMVSSWSVQWGGSSYFTSYVRSAFQLMPTAMLIMALNLVLVKIDGKATKALAFCVIPIFAGLQGGSRTYFILILIMGLLVLMNCRLSKAQIMIVTALASAIVVWQFASSGIASKIINVTSTQQMGYSGMGLLGTFTSGRSEFWQADITAFFNLSPLQQLVGNGFSFPYETNLEAVGNSIFAHNDFINLLMESGYIGLIVYLVTIGSLIAILSKKTSRQIVLVVIMLWLFNAFFNSFYPYTSSVIAWGITIIALRITSPLEDGE